MVNNQLKKNARIAGIQSHSTVYQLTKAMVGDKNYNISPAICTRVVWYAAGF
jgi:hypothetical protein